jgi:Recombination endonuclease VII
LVDPERENFWNGNPVSSRGKKTKKPSAKGRDAKARKLARDRERSRQRYADDPEYREKKCARHRRWKRRRYAEDPEFRQRVLVENRVYGAANRDRINETRRSRYEHDVECRERILASAARSRLKVKYGLSWEDYQKLLALQDGRCGICGEESDKLCVDHCHETGAVRGLLCPRCNSGTGFFRDDPKRTRAATRYLEAFLKARPRGGQ